MSESPTGETGLNPTLMSYFGLPNLPPATSVPPSAGEQERQEKSAIRLKADESIRVQRALSAYGQAREPAPLPGQLARPASRVEERLVKAAERARTRSAGESMLSSPPPPQAPAAQLKGQLAWLEDMEKRITERVAAEEHIETRAAELLTLERERVLDQHESQALQLKRAGLMKRAASFKRAASKLPESDSTMQESVARASAAVQNANARWLHAAATADAAVAKAKEADSLRRSTDAAYWSQSETRRADQMFSYELALAKAAERAEAAQEAQLDVALQEARSLGISVHKALRQTKLTFSEAAPARPPSRGFTSSFMGGFGRRTPTQTKMDSLLDTLDQAVDSLNANAAVKVLRVKLERDPLEGFGLGVGYDGEAVMLSAIGEGTPASRCGQLRKGDRVVAINGEPVSTASDFRMLLKATTVTFEIMRFVDDGYELEEAEADGTAAEEYGGRAAAADEERQAASEAAAHAILAVSQSSPYPGNSKHSQMQWMSQSPLQSPQHSRALSPHPTRQGAASQPSSQPVSMRRAIATATVASGASGERTWTVASGVASGGNSASFAVGAKASVIAAAKQPASRPASRAASVVGDQTIDEGVQRLEAALEATRTQQATMDAHFKRQQAAIAEQMRKHEEAEQRWGAERANEMARLRRWAEEQRLAREGQAPAERPSTRPSTPVDDNVPVTRTSSFGRIRSRSGSFGRMVLRLPQVLKRAQSLTRASTRPSTPVHASINLHASASIFEVRLSRRSKQESLGIGVGFDASGATVLLSIKPGSPAERFGALEIGDQILSVGGTLVSPETNFVELLASSGLLVTLTIKRTVEPSDATTTPTPSTAQAVVSRNNSFQSRGHLPPRVTSRVTLVRSSLQESLGLGVGFDANGAIILSSIKPGSPAERCGTLEINDRIVAVGSRTVTADTDFSALLASAGVEVTLTVSRSFDGHALPRSGRSSPAVPAYEDAAQSPPSGGRAISIRRLEIPLAAVSPASIAVDKALRVRLQREAHEGFGLGLGFNGKAVMISAIGEGTPASRCGQLRKGDRVVAINGEPVSIASDFRALLSATTVVTFEIMRTAGMQGRDGDGEAEDNGPLERQLLSPVAVVERDRLLARTMPSRRQLMPAAFVDEEPGSTAEEPRQMASAPHMSHSAAVRTATDDGFKAGGTAAPSKALNTADGKKPLHRSSTVGSTVGSRPRTPSDQLGDGFKGVVGFFQAVFGEDIDKSDSGLELEFDKMDKNGSGMIDASEMKVYLNRVYEKRLDDKTIAKMIEEADLNQDGAMDLNEFKIIMRAGPKKKSDGVLGGAVDATFGATVGGVKAIGDGAAFVTKQTVDATVGVVKTVGVATADGVKHTSSLVVTGTLASLHAVFGEAPPSPELTEPGRLQPERLPPGWYQSSASGGTYYWREDGTVQWERPGTLPPPLEHARMQLMDVTLVRVMKRQSLGLGVGFDASGATLLRSIAPASPAEICGALEVGDHIVAVGGRPVSSDTDFSELLASAGLDVTLTIARLPKQTVESGRKVQATLVRSSLQESLGLGVGFDANGAMLLLSMKPGSPAERCGTLEINDRIVAVGSRTVTADTDFSALLASAGVEVTLTVLRALRPSAGRMSPLLAFATEQGTSSPSVPPAVSSGAAAGSSAAAATEGSTVQATGRNVLQIPRDRVQLPQPEEPPLQDPKVKRTTWRSQSQLIVGAVTAPFTSRSDVAKPSPMQIPTSPPSLMQIPSSASSSSSSMLPVPAYADFAPQPREVSPLASSLSTPRSLPSSSSSPESSIAMIRQLKGMLDEGLITQEQFAKKRAELLMRV